ncbi:MAG: hypothetical protein HYY15_03600 [Candidatus Omnitrophica bacterium]|nr:hypothetical protein [Candidatus Omnitrophota bacterium]
MHSSSDSLRAQRHLAWALMAAAITARALPHPPNVTLLSAIALFGGTALPKRWSLIVPLASIAISDALIGFHDVILFTWAGVALTAVLGWWVRREPRPGRIVRASLIGSTMFFLLTNFGVWLVGSHGAMYPKTLEGLWSCYAAAVPFYRNALVADLIYTGSLFAAYAWMSRRLGVPAMAVSR